MSKPFDVASVTFERAPSPRVAAPTANSVPPNDGEAAQRRAEIAGLLGKIVLKDARGKLAEMSGRPVGNRDAWIKVGIAAKSYEPSADAEFVAWSREQPGFKDDADCVTQWRSFDKSRTAARVTADTLRWLAGEAGSAVASADDFAVVDGEASGDSDGLVQVRALNKDHFAVRIKGKPFVCREDDDGSLEFMTPEDFSKWHAANKIALKNGDKVTRRRIGDLWWEWQGKRTYTRIVLKPNGDAAHGEFNLWRGYSVRPKPGNWSLFREHIRQIICSGDERIFNWVLDWLAHLVQKPGERGHVAIALIGEKGTGKGKFADIVGALFPHNYLVPGKAEEVVGRFNASLERGILLFLDELLFAGDRATADALKSKITERIISIEEKFLPRRQVENLLHVIAASNHEHALHLEPGDRRWVVIKVSEARKQDTKHFAAIDRQMLDRGGLAAMLHDLQHRDISEFEPRLAPITEAKIEQQLASLDPVPRWIGSLLSEEEIPFVGEWGEQSVVVERGQFYEAYQRWHAANEKRRSLVDVRAFWPQIGAWTGGQQAPRGSSHVAKRARRYCLPPIDLAREWFDAKMRGGPMGTNETSNVVPLNPLKSKAGTNGTSLPNANRQLVIGEDREGIIFNPAQSAEEIFK